MVGSGEKEEKRKEGKNKNLEIAFMIMRLDKGMTKPAERGSAGRGKGGCQGIIQEGIGYFRIG